MATLQRANGDAAPLPDPNLDDAALMRLRDMIAVNLLAAGWSQRDLAELFNVSPPTVNRWMRAIPPEAVEHCLAVGIEGVL